MKYFTPELLDRFGSAEDEVAQVASKEWEQAHERYLAHLQEIKAKIPKRVRLLLRRYYLHDAKVLTIAYDEQPFFSIFLQLDTPSKEMIELRYRLAGRPRCIQHSVISDGEKPWQWWLYDEFEVVLDKEKERFLPIFMHSILLTGGVELELPFYDLRCRRFGRAMFPGSEAASEQFGRELGVMCT